MLDIAKLPPDLREAALMFAAGQDHDEAIHPDKPCPWCGGTGADPTASNRARYFMHNAWYFTPPGEEPFADGVVTRVVRLACFHYDQARAQGVILCPLATAIERCNELAAAGFAVFDGVLPKPEWCCPRCEGTGEDNA